MTRITSFKNATSVPALRQHMHTFIDLMTDFEEKKR
jgi:hypothetical protein